MRSIAHRHVLNADFGTHMPGYAMVPDELIAEDDGRGIQLYIVLNQFPVQFPDATPSTAMLAALMGCSKNTMRKTMARLIANGWLWRYLMRREDGGHGVPLYVVNAVRFEDHDATVEGWLRINGLSLAEAVAS